MKQPYPRDGNLIDTLPTSPARRRGIQVHAAGLYPTCNDGVTVTVSADVANHEYAGEVRPWVPTLRH